LKKPKSFSIESYLDFRGKIEFSNDFSFSKFKRMYMISSFNEGQIRAWQGHELEEKAFIILNGKVKLVLIPVIDFESEITEKPIEYILDANEPQIIYVPGGFLNGFQFLTSNSRLQIHSTFTLLESQKDDFRFESKKFYNWDKCDS
jgi:dTDP-4-dehydrorhamnose 3,5-epimerase-like enzyme